MKAALLASDPMDNVLAPCATPRYAVHDANSKTYDYIVVGGNIDAVDTAQKMSQAYPYKKILIIDSESELGVAHPPSSRVLLPLRVATKAARHELINKRVTEWCARKAKLPIAPEQSSVFNMSSEESPLMLFINEQGSCLNYTDELIAELKAGSNQDNGEIINAVARDFAFFREINRLKHLEKDTSEHEAKRLRDNLELLRNNRNVEVSLDSPVLMINYKTNVVATKKARYSFKEAVVYGAITELLLKDGSHHESPQAVRFFPNLPSDKVEAIRTAHFDVDRAILSFDSDFWSKTLKEGTKSFYVKLPDWHVPLHFRALENNCIEAIFSDCSPLKNNRDQFSFDRLKLEAKGILRALSAVFNISFIVDEHNKTVSYQPVQQKKSLTRVVLTGIKRIDSNEPLSKGVFLESKIANLSSVLRRPVSVLDVDVIPKVYFIVPTQCNSDVSASDLTIQQLVAQEQYISSPKSSRTTPRTVAKSVDYGF